MNQLTPGRRTDRTDCQQEGGADETIATNSVPSTCDMALEGMIVLLARHICQVMTSVDEPDAKGDVERPRDDKIG